jgi:hypothetical protein
MAGRQLLVFLGRVGWKEMNSWTDTSISLQNGIWVAKQPPTRKTLDWATGRTFSMELMAKVGQMFLTTLQAGTAPFDDGRVQMPASSAGLGPRDLVCYVCKDESDSIIKSFDPAGFRAAMAKAQKEHPGKQVGGMTVPLNRRDGTPGGICSELYLRTDEPDTTYCAGIIFHELMHNKTNYAAGEDADWVHTRGGGGVASASSSGLEGVNPQNAAIMCGRLQISNAQFTDGFMAAP